MSTEKIETNSDFKLNEKSDYATWLQYWNLKATTEGAVLQDGTFTTETAKVKFFRNLLIKTIGAKFIKHVNFQKSIDEILAKLEIECGSSLVSDSTIIESYKKKVFFPRVKNPQKVFNWLDDELHALSMNEENTARIKFELLKDGLSPRKYSDNFWLECYASCKNLKYDSSSYDSLKSLILEHWLNRTDEDTVVSALRDSKAAAPTNGQPAVNLLDTSNMQIVLAAEFAKFQKALALSKKPEKVSKFCRFCSDPANGRTRIGKTHNDDTCFYGANPGFEILPEQAARHAEVQASLRNKRPQEYSVHSMYYDTGATASTNTDGSHLQPTTAIFQTAKHGESIKSLGTNKLGFGKLTVKSHHSPKFTKSLVSGIEVMRQGYASVLKDEKLVICDKVVIPTDAEIVATGSVEAETGLIKLDSTIKLNNRFEVLGAWQDLHEKLGHAADGMMRKSYPEIERQTEDCEACAATKMRHPNISKKRSTPLEVLEVVSADISFKRVPAHDDGSTADVKFVDKKSKWIKREPILNKEAATIKSKFQPWSTMMERKTGKFIKAVECDDGAEFKGSFSRYLRKHGIQKFQTDAYDSHFPGQAENANKNIASSSRANLFASKLPLNFYCYSDAYSVYMWNRTIHAGDSITPFEHIHGYSPPMHHIQKFGCVGFAFQSKKLREKAGRAGNPLAHRGLRCRLLGFTDDNGSVEKKGYKVLVEDGGDPYIMETRYVKWLPQTPMTALPGTVPYCASDDADLVPEDSPVRTDQNYIEDLVEEADNDTDDEAGYETAPDFDVLSESDEDEIDPLLLSVEEKIEVCSEIERKYGEVLDNTVVDSETIMYMLLALTDGIPVSYKEAVSGPEAHLWKAAIEVEYSKMLKTKTWDLVEKVPGSNVVKCKWVFRKKYDSAMSVKEYKARLVAKGFTQKYGVDYLETFAPVAKLKSVRVLMALSAALGFTCYQDDVPHAFLWPDLKEILYMQQPEGFDDQSGRVCLLKKTIYGLKQANREFNNLMEEYLVQDGFTASPADPCIYIKRDSNGAIVLMVAIYVDDLITAGLDSGPYLHAFRQKIHKRFNMKPGEKLEWYLGCKFSVDELGGISMDQISYLTTKLAEFADHIGNGARSHPLPSNLQELLDEAETSTETDPTFPYHSMVSSLMYAMISTRPDLAFAISVVCKFLKSPKKIHCQIVKHIYQYVRGNLNYKLYYRSGGDPTLIGFADAAYGNNFNFKSTTGYCFLLNGGIVSWFSKMQSVVARSAAEAEYIAADEAAKEAIWLKSLLSSLGFPQKTVSIYEDNQACIALTKNPQYHSRTKHIQIHYHGVREYVKNGEIAFPYIPTKDQLGDLFTKGLSGVRMRFLLQKCAVIKSQGEN